MDPWYVIGWLVLSGIALWFVAILAALVRVLFTDYRIKRKFRRANLGKLKCEYPDCVNISTRRGASGFVCEKHVGSYLARSGAVSFAFRLDHAKKKNV